MHLIYISDYIQSFRFSRSMIEKCYTPPSLLCHAIYLFIFLQQNLLMIQTIPEIPVINTHTHTHTHMLVFVVYGDSPYGVMVFILYKPYVLLPYTYPTPKLSPHRRRCISTFPPKNIHCMIYKHFKLWGHWKCPHKSPSPCNTYIIPMSLYKFVSS